MYLFCLVQQAQEDLHAKYKEMEKELKLYKEKEAALAAPPVLSAPPKVVPSAPPQVVAPPKVVSSAPSIPPAGLLQEDSLASSALPGESLDGSFANAKAVVEKCFVITGKKKDAQAKRKIAISNVFRNRSFALDGAAVAQEMLKLAGGFGDEIIGQMGMYLTGKQRKAEQDANESVPIDQIVRDERKSQNAVVDRHLQKVVDETPDLDSLELPELRDGVWPVDVLLLNVPFRTIVTAARGGFSAKSGLNTHAVSRSWIANGFVRFEEIKVYTYKLFSFCIVLR